MSTRPKEILYGLQAKQALKAGIDQVATAVRATLGPRGKTAVLAKPYGNPTITKDGVTVARFIELEDPFQNEGAKLCREVAARTNDIAGDGTTTATVLAQAIVEEGLKYVSAGGNPLAVKRGIDAAVEDINEILTSISIDIAGDYNWLLAVATIAGNSEAVGETITRVYRELGQECVISVEKSTGMTTTVEYMKGLQFDRGFLSPHFVTRGREAVLEEPLVLLIERRLSTIDQDALVFLDGVAKTSRPLLVIADEVDGEWLATLVINHIQGRLRSCAVKAPSFGDHRKAIMSDLAVVTGGVYITEDMGRKISSIALSELGSAKEVVVTDSHITIKATQDAKEKIEARVADLKKELQEADSRWDAEKLQERIAKLSSGIAVIKVGGSSDVDINELRDRYIDSIGATKAAIEEGVVPGGGSALLFAYSQLSAIGGRRTHGNGGQTSKSPGNASSADAGPDEDEEKGYQIVLNALKYPLLWMANNAGMDGHKVIYDVLSAFKKKHHRAGYDLRSLRPVLDMTKAGIVDPTKVVKSALQNAAAIAGLVLTTEVLVCEKQEPNREKSHEGKG